MYPRCPNHDVECDPTDNARIWVCPVSTARFEFDVDQENQEVQYDKYGNPMQSYTIISNGEE